jgi:hypothetical protein
MIAELSNLNQYLKIFSLASLTLLFLMTTLCVLTTRKPPLVLAFAESGAVLQSGALPKAEDQIRGAVGAYLALRYRWTPKDVITQLTAAESFVGSSALKTYRVAMAGIARFAIEKQVEQRVFSDRIEVNLEGKTAQVAGDRITVAQALRATTPLSLVLKFEYGARTRENPWGIYIIQEKEAQ